MHIPQSQHHHNYNALPYALGISQRLQELTLPLFRTFDLTTFGYKRLLQDGRYIFVSTNQPWVEHHLKNIHTHGNFFTTAMNDALLTDGFHRVLWPGRATDHFLEALHYWKMWNGINFYKKNGDFIELWTFSTSPDKYQDPNAYLNILPYLERFIVYFNATTADIFSKADDQKLAVCNDGQTIFSPSPLLNPDACLITFLEQTTINQLPVHGKNGLCYLSKQESRCLKLLATGKSAKEIANFLNLSPRTVEGYIDHIKLKLGYSCKSALIHTLNESLLRLGYKGEGLF